MTVAQYSQEQRVCVNISRERRHEQMGANLWLKIMGKASNSGSYFSG
jgi:hypothetical protein